MTFEEWKALQFKIGNFWYAKRHSGDTKKGDLVGIWKTKYIEKKSRAKRDNIIFTLEFEEYISLLFKANLSNPDQLGQKSEQYQLARYKDLGGYTVNNCRFITKLENMKERDEHFNVKAHVAKQLKEGTHPFSGDLQKRLISEGRHNLVGKLPWENNSSKPTSLEVWYNAQKCYSWWLESRKGFYKMKTHFGFSSEKACRNMIKKFKEGWIPSEDNNWKEWRDVSHKTSTGSG